MILPILVFYFCLVSLSTDGYGVVIYGMIVGSIMYCYWMIFLCSDGTLMSSASVVHGNGYIPSILDITYITCYNIYYIGGFAMDMSSYGVRVVGFIGNHLGGVHMGAG